MPEYQFQYRMSSLIPDWLRPGLLVPRCGWRAHALGDPHTQEPHDWVPAMGKRRH